MDYRHPSQHNGVSSNHYARLLAEDPNILNGSHDLEDERYDHDFQQLRPLPLDDVHDAGSVVQSTATTAYQKYPTEQPFVYDRYRRDPSKNVKAYPESNRQAVMSALKSLQEKIRSLEIERSQAERNLKTLSSETSKFKDLVSREVDMTDNDAGPSVSYANTTRGTEIQTKLDTAEQRCKLLEKQLDCMRNMVQNAEYDRSDAMRKSAILGEQRVQSEQEDVRRQMEKIGDLEREHLKLTATQTLAENKIRELEEKLKEERHHRKYMQTRAAEMETAAEAHRILTEATENATHRPKSKKVKKKKRPASAKATCNSNRGNRPVSANNRKLSRNVECTKKPGMEPPEHYKLDLGQIPFISGKSTTPSHSLAANFQEVLSLMKSHNPKLCKSPRSHTKTPGLAYFQDKPLTAENFHNRDLTDLLMQLQDEFGQMSFEHQELNQQIQASTDPRLQEDLERELDALVAKMEVKGQQIARLRRHQEKLRAKNLAKKVANPASSTMEVPVRDTDLDLDGQVEVTTTIRTKGKGDRTRHTVIPSTSQGSSLNLYKGLKKIQNTLRKDDLSWDC